MLINKQYDCPTSIRWKMIPANVVNVITTADSLHLHVTNQI